MGDLPVTCDNRVFCYTSSTGMVNYREAKGTTRTERGKRYPIEGYGDLPPTVRSSSGEVPVLLHDIAHVRSLVNHFLF